MPSYLPSCYIVQMIAENRNICPSLTFATERARETLKGSIVRAGKTLHPSPASPAANRGRKNIVLEQLRDQGSEFWPFRERSKT